MYDDIDFADQVIHDVLKHIRKEPRGLLYSMPPEDLATDLIDLMAFKSIRPPAPASGYSKAVDAWFGRIHRRLVPIIRKMKADNQLTAFELPNQVYTTFQEKLLKQVSREFPGAFKRSRRRTRRTFGIKQVTIEFPLPPEPSRLLIDLFDDDDLGELPECFRN